MTELTILAQYNATHSALSQLVTNVTTPKRATTHTVSLVVAEEGPRSHLVTFESATYEIWVPWSVYAVQKWRHTGAVPSYLQHRGNTRYFMGWRTAPMERLTDDCRGVSLPNAYSHTPCLGMAVGHEDKGLSPLTCLYRAWWYGVINTDGWPGMLCAPFRTALLGGPGNYGNFPYDFDDYHIIRQDMRRMLRAWEDAGDHAPAIWAEAPSGLSDDEANLEQHFPGVPDQILSAPIRRCRVPSLAPVACGAQP